MIIDIVTERTENLVNNADAGYQHFLFSECFQ